MGGGGEGGEEHESKRRDTQWESLAVCSSSCFLLLHCLLSLFVCLLACLFFGLFCFCLYWQSIF